MQDTSSLSFANDSVDLDQLPRADHADMNAIDERQRTIDYIYATIFWIVVGIAAAVVLYFVDEPRWVLYLILIVLPIFCILSFLYVSAHYRHILWALREHDILFHEGVFWKSKTAVPFNRIQHAEVNQNPIERKNGLARLKIYTAGGMSSDVSIHGLRETLAEDIKAFILSRMVQIEEE